MCVSLGLYLMWIEVNSVQERIAFLVTGTNAKVKRAECRLIRLVFLPVLCIEFPMCFPVL